jgi:hypothetical protein
MTVFYCLRFEIPSTRRARSPSLYPTGTGWSSYTPRHRVPFSSPATTRRATVKVFEPASTRGTQPAGLGPSLYSLGADPTENTTSSSPVVVGGCVAIVRTSYRVNVFTEPLLRNGRLFICLLYSNGCTRCSLRGLCLAKSSCATVFLKEFILLTDNIKSVNNTFINN